METIPLNSCINTVDCHSLWRAILEADNTCHSVSLRSIACSSAQGVNLLNARYAVYDIESTRSYLCPTSNTRYKGVTIVTVITTSLKATTCVNTVDDIKHTSSIVWLNITNNTTNRVLTYYITICNTVINSSLNLSYSRTEDTTSIIL